jgi:hypothetical protein
MGLEKNCAKKWQECYTKSLFSLSRLDKLRQEEVQQKFQNKALWVSLGTLKKNLLV